MDLKFKWDMFITSFLPLWFSIVVSNIWAIFIEYHKLTKSVEIKFGEMFFKDKFALLLTNIRLEFLSIIIIMATLILSITSINNFINTKQKTHPKPKGKIVCGRRANKLSSEFLIAYILPIIVFNFSDLKSVVLFTIYFCVLAYLCIRNNNIYTNLYLEFKKYKMYICDIECCILDEKYLFDNCLVISKENLAGRVETTIEYFDFDNYVYIKL